jgi:hypothetical protein
MGKKHSPYGKGTFIESKIFRSKAFLSLGQKGTSPVVSTISPQLLILFFGKRDFRRPGGKGARTCVNCDHLTMTYAELENGPVKWSRQRITRAIDELLAKGFIEIVEQGGAYQQHKSVYALSDNWHRWEPRTVCSERPRDLRRGYQGKAVGATAGAWPI